MFNERKQLFSFEIHIVGHSLVRIFSVHCDNCSLITKAHVAVINDKIKVDCTNYLGDYKRDLKTERDTT